MHVSMTLPLSVVGPLRRGAYVALRPAIEEAVDLLGEQARAEHSQMSSESFARLMQARDLLNALGWSEAEALPESTIDLSEHGGALAVALDNALKAGLDDLAQPDEQPGARACEAMHALCGFAMFIDAADIERSKSRVGAREFEQSAEMLLAELDREEVEPGGSVFRQFT
jgi:hypothetical protein